MRTKIIAGNWKMNVKPSETAALVKEIAEATKAYANVDVVCCTPAIDIPAATSNTTNLFIILPPSKLHMVSSKGPECR